MKSPKDFIRRKAYELGFLSVGFSKAEFLETEAPRLEDWLRNNRHGEMGYMENHFEKRLDPEKLVPGTKTVVSFLYNYFPPKRQRPDSPKISTYAYGRDYHKVVKKKGIILLKALKEEFGDVQGRVFVDSAPVLEKAWAEKSGLGWRGKNSNLISKSNGSFFFLAELFIDLDLEPDSLFRKDHCGTCRKCIDACPTEAIIEPYKVDGSKCISYLTIELKGQIPDWTEGQLDDWIFGCDVCQDVCPWNRFSKPHNEPDFLIREAIENRSRAEWEELTEEAFEETFRGSAVKRTGYSGLIRNVQALKKKP